MILRVSSKVQLPSGMETHSLVYLGSCAEENFVYWEINVSAKAPQMGTKTNVELRFVDGGHRLGSFQSNEKLGCCRSSKLLENIPTSRMPPPQFASSNRDIIEVTPQFPMNNSHFEPRSSTDHSHSFKRPRMSDNSHSYAPMGPPPRMNHPPPNRPTGNIFFKTRICTKFGFGTCRNGRNCTFAHGVEEIRLPPQNWQELVGPRTEERMQLGGNWNDDQKIIHEMNLCKKYYNGEECPYGDKCSFLHEDPAKFRDDSWKTRESSAISIATFGDGSNSFDGNRAGGTKPASWKTNLCFKWLNTGSCPFGDGCHFAHGDAELLVPGGGIEVEAAVTLTNSTKAVIPTLPTTALSGSAPDAPTTLPPSVSAVAEEEKKTKKELLWLKLNKINRIYGDWID